MATDITATNNKDSYLDQIAPTYKAGGDVLFHVKGETNRAKRPVFDWTLPAGAGVITAIQLYLYTYGDDGTGFDDIVEVHELTEDFVEAEVTWNRRSDADAWTAPGGTFDATIVDSLVVDTFPQWYAWDLGPGATNPIAGLTWGSTIKLLLKVDTEDIGSNIYSRWYSKETAQAQKPYIKITYTPPAVGRSYGYILG